MSAWAQIVREVFSEIERDNPSVAFERFEESVEGQQLPRARVRAQPNCTIPLDLYLYSDELYLDCGAFHASWFPIEDRSVQVEYMAQVGGLLKGSHRVVEYCRGSRIARADLQVRDGALWRTVSRFGLLTWPWPRLRKTAILINDAGATP